MKFCRVLFPVLMVMGTSGSLVGAAQTPAPALPQPTPPMIAPAPVRRDAPVAPQAGASRPGATAADLGPIIANGNSAAYVSAESTGHPAVFMGSDATPYGIIGTFSNHPLGFRTNNIARLFIDTNGNVGIGTTSPATRLHIANASNSGAGLFVEASEGDRAAMYYSPNTGMVFDSFRPGDGRRLPILLQPNGGDVGIGTAVPHEKLHVVKSGAGGALISASLQSGLQLSAANGTGGYYLGRAYGSDDANDFFLYDVTNGKRRFGVTTGGDSFFEGNVSVGTTSSSSRLTVQGTNLGTCGPALVAWGATVPRTCNAALAITTDNPAGSDLIEGRNDSGLVFAVTGTGTVCATNVSCASDARLKQNVTALSYGLGEVLRLRPVRWQWKDPTTTQLNLGLVAQDVEPLLPELILRNVDAKGSLGLNYFGFVPIMIKAIQEQQDTIATLGARNASLEARLTALEQTLRKVHRVDQ